MRATAVLVVLAVAFAIAAPAVQALTGWGLSASEFSAQGDGTLRAAGYAFSIWGLIYVGLGAYALYQLRPSRGPAGLSRRLALPATVAAAACGAWIFASAADWRWATVAIISVGAAALIFGLWRAVPTAAAADRGEKALVLWPLALLAGWLTAASALNWITVLTAEGFVPSDAADTVAAVGVAATLALAAVVVWRTRLIPYAAAVVWALAAIWVAEREEGRPLVAVLALGGAVALALLALAVSARRR